MRVNLHDLGFENGFLVVTIAAKATNEKKINWTSKWKAFVDQRT